MSTIATNSMPTAGSILSLLDGIERVGPDAPAAIAFKAALRRKGAEAFEAGGVDLVEDLQRAVAEADPDRASARTAIVHTAWANRRVE